MSLKLGTFKVYPQKYDDNYFVFYPNDNGCPIENGAGEYCLIGGEVKTSLFAETIEEKIRLNSQEEFWEETGCKLSSLEIISERVKFWEGVGFGMYFIEISPDQLQTLATQINANFQKVQEEYIPRIKSKDFSSIPTVWSNELEVVELETLEAAITRFRSMDPLLADWFVTSLVSYCTYLTINIFFLFFLNV